MDNIINIDKNVEITTFTPAKRFVFISDLHFDCFYHDVLSSEKFKDDDAFLEREDTFIQFVKEHFSNDILILAGDYYTNYRQSLSFIKRLEESKITSYFVLGNHDFASNNGTKFNIIISLFDSETSSHKYCKLLMTGKKYYHEDVCIIGDTGWSKTSVNPIIVKGAVSLRPGKKAREANENSANSRFLL